MRSIPIADGEASSKRMAVKGRAVRVTSDPKVETVAAPHRWTNLEFPQRPPRCIKIAMPLRVKRREL